MKAISLIKVLLFAAVLSACSEAPAPVAIQPSSAPAPAPAAVIPDTPAPQLARETADLIKGLQGTLITAVRQRDTRGGKDDFWRFIDKPVMDMQARWSARPREQNLDWIPCIMALGEFANHARDSFKAGEIGKPGSLLTDNLPACEKLATQK